MYRRLPDYMELHFALLMESPTCTSKKFSEAKNEKWGSYDSLSLMIMKCFIMGESYECSCMYAFGYCVHSYHIG